MGGMFPCHAGPVGTMTYKEGTKGPLRGGPWSEADLSVGNDDDTRAQRPLKGALPLPDTGLTIR